jgi:hypothetical protein
MFTTQQKDTRDTHHLLTTTATRMTGSLPVQKRNNPEQEKICAVPLALCQCVKNQSKCHYYGSDSQEGYSKLLVRDVSTDLFTIVRSRGPFR